MEPPIWNPAREEWGNWSPEGEWSPAYEASPEFESENEKLGREEQAAARQQHAADAPTDWSAVPATAHAFEEILDQQSSPDPVTALQHEVAEKDAQASLPDPAPLDVTVEEVSRLPADAPTDWSGEQAQEYFEQRSHLPPEAGTTPYDAQAEEQAQGSLMTNAEQGAHSAAGTDSTLGQPDGADTTPSSDSPETTLDESPLTSHSDASSDAGSSAGGERTDDEPPAGEHWDSAAARWQQMFDESDARAGRSPRPATDLGREPSTEDEDRAAPQQHAAAARERSPDAPTGDERSTEWALRFSTGVVPAGVSVPLGLNVRSAELGFDTLRLEIMDRTTGAIGTFVFTGLEASVGWSIPGDPQWSNGAWKEFNTSETSLNEFGDDIVRHVQYPFNLFESLQFTWTDVKHDSNWDTFWYADGVDVSDLGESFENPEAGWSAGPLNLAGLRWEPMDPWGNLNAQDGTFELNPEKRLQPTEFKEALAEGVQEFVDRMTQEAVAQLPPEAVPATAHAFQEILDQQSSPDPVTAQQHEVAEADAQASLPDPAPLDLTAEGLAQQSLPTDQQLDEQQAVIDHAQAEEQGQHSLMTDAQHAEQEADAAAGAGGDSTSEQPQGADTTAPPDSPETTPDQSPPTPHSDASGDAIPSEGGAPIGGETPPSEGSDTSPSEVDPLAALDQDLAQQQDAESDQKAQAAEADRDAQASAEGAASEAAAGASEAEASQPAPEQEPPADGGGG